MCNSKAFLHLIMCWVKVNLFSLFCTCLMLVSFSDFFLAPLKPRRVSEFLFDKHQHTGERTAELLQHCLSETAPHCCRAMQGGSLLALQRSLFWTKRPSYTTTKLHFRNYAPQLYMEGPDTNQAASQDAVSEPLQICSVYIQPLHLVLASTLTRS